MNHGIPEHGRPRELGPDASKGPFAYPQLMPRYNYAEAAVASGRVVYGSRWACRAEIGDGHRVILRVISDNRLEEGHHDGRQSEYRPCPPAAGAGRAGDERSRLSALVRAAQAHLIVVETIIARLEQSGYGACEVCLQPIPAARLEVRPTASTCSTRHHRPCLSLRHVWKADLAVADQTGSPRCKSWPRRGTMSLWSPASRRPLRQSRRPVPRGGAR